LRDKLSMQMVLMHRPIMSFHPSNKSNPSPILVILLFALSLLLEFIFEDKEVDERFLHRFEIISILRVSPMKINFVRVTWTRSLNT
jgi:hypothetical protein